MKQIKRQPLNLVDSCCHFKVGRSSVKFWGKNLGVPNYVTGYADRGIASVSLVSPS